MGFLVKISKLKLAKIFFFDISFEVCELLFYFKFKRLILRAFLNLGLI